MVLLTMIARINDGLPLTASIEGNEELGRTLVEYQNQAKQLFKKLNHNSPPRCSLNSNDYTFHYLLDNGIVYLTLCENTFSKKLAFSYLEDLQSEFNSRYGNKVFQVTRPYTFIEFDNYIQKAKKSFIDSRTRKNLSNINTQLQDVQKIMVQNIDDVLQRGEALSILDDKAVHLSTMSQKYKKDAHTLNLKSAYVKIGILVFIVLTLCLYIRFWWF